MEHSEDYKVPLGFNLGVEHSLEMHGVAVTYQNGEVDDLQKELIQLFNRLASCFNEFSPVDSWLKGVGDRAPTEVMDEKRSAYLSALRDAREDVLNKMMEIFRAGAEPLTVDRSLDLDLARVFDTGMLLRDAAITAVGGMQGRIYRGAGGAPAPPTIGAAMEGLGGIREEEEVEKEEK